MVAQQMSTTSPPFDESSPKYYCCFKKLHIRTAARVVSIALIVGIVINLLYSFGRTSTVIIYSWILASFAVGVYGSLTYAVFREKRIFTMPFLVFQATFIFLSSLIFLVFMICAMFSSHSIGRIAEDFAGIKREESDWHAYGEELRGFVAMAMLLTVMFICLQCWFFEIIYRFYHYLEDRESSFAFNLETEFSVS
ncbi:hypothetical protein niasHS_018070 [Heterodera schachtii]|uniref:Uncharacterized protein n=2 Tax=Heterodera TaxID=34509 RepID=A0ABD2JLI8_9BILA